MMASDTFCGNPGSKEHMFGLCRCFGRFRQNSNSAVVQDTRPQWKPRQQLFDLKSSKQENGNVQTLVSTSVQREVSRRDSKFYTANPSKLEELTRLDQSKFIPPERQTGESNIPNRWDVLKGRSSIVKENLELHKSSQPEHKPEATSTVMDELVQHFGKILWGSNSANSKRKSKEKKLAEAETFAQISSKRPKEFSSGREGASAVYPGPTGIWEALQGSSRLGPKKSPYTWLKEKVSTNLQRSTQKLDVRMQQGDTKSSEVAVTHFQTFDKKASDVQRPRAVTDNVKTSKGLMNGLKKSIKDHVTGMGVSTKTLPMPSSKPAGNHSHQMPPQALTRSSRNSSWQKDDGNDKDWKTVMKKPKKRTILPIEFDYVPVKERDREAATMRQKKRKSQKIRVPYLNPNSSAPRFRRRKHHTLLDVIGIPRSNSVRPPRNTMKDVPKPTDEDTAAKTPDTDDSQKSVLEMAETKTFFLEELSSSNLFVYSKEFLEGSRSNIVMDIKDIPNYPWPESGSSETDSIPEYAASVEDSLELQTSTVNTPHSSWSCLPGWSMPADAKNPDPPRLPESKEQKPIILPISQIPNYPWPESEDNFVTSGTERHHLMVNDVSLAYGYSSASSDFVDWSEPKSIKDGVSLAPGHQMRNRLVRSVTAVPRRSTSFRYEIGTMTGSLEMSQRHHREPILRSPLPSRARYEELSYESMFGLICRATRDEDLVIPSGGVYDQY